jgi:hypothetical protein
MDAIGHLLALHVTPADEQDRAKVQTLPCASQRVTGENVELAFVDQGNSGEEPAADPNEHGIRLEVTSTRGAREALCSCYTAGKWSAILRGLGRFRKLVRDYERLPETRLGYTCRFLHRAIAVLGSKL